MRPQHPTQHNSQEAQALKHLAANEPHKALALLQPLVQQHPEKAQAWHLIGLCHYLSQNLSEACFALDKATKLRPMSADFHADFGLALQAAGDLETAQRIYEQALKIEPSHINALFNLATLHQEALHYHACTELYLRCLELRPLHAKTHYNLAKVYAQMHAYGQAIHHFRQAIDIEPNHVDSWIALASACQHLGEMELALRSLETAIRLSPENAIAHFNRSLLLLATEQFSQGWREFEWRWQACTNLHSNYRGNQPLWLGQMPLQGLNLLLHCEQGFGDTLQCARYLSLLHAHGAHLTLLVDPSLIRLFSRLEVAIKLITPSEPLPAHDAHCPLMSLPLAMGLQQHPALPNAPYLHVNPEDITARLATLPNTPAQQRIGIAWRGSALHANDQNRSVPLADFLTHLPVGPLYVVLQKDVSTQELQMLQARPDMLIGVKVSDDFYDTAALCCAMDSVLTVDTSIAHLAGALGCQVFLMLAQPCDWRWHREGAAHAWYRRLTIIRQDQPHDWQSVLTQIASRLKIEPA